MVKRIVAFGDSWTNGHGVEEDITYKEVAKPPTFIANLRLNNSWVRWLAEKFNVPFVNMGIAGICNARILFELRENIKFLNKENDLIIVMLSFPYRHHNWIDTVPVMDRPLGNIILSITALLEGYNYFIFNSFYPTFKDEPDIKSNLNIDLSRFIEVDYTAAEVLLSYEEEHNVPVWEYGSRVITPEKYDKNGDYHPNLLGYRIISEWIFKLIKDRV